MNTEDGHAKQDIQWMVRQAKKRPTKCGAVAEGPSSFRFRSATISIIATVLPAVRTATVVIAVPVVANVSVLSCKGRPSWEVSSTRQLTTAYSIAPRDTRRWLSLLVSSRDRQMTAMDMTAALAVRATTCQSLGKGPLVSFSCPCHEVFMLSNDSDGDTCSRISCAGSSVTNSNQCLSVDLFLDDTVLVQCDDVYSLDGTPEGSSFTITCLKVWRTCLRRNLCQDCLSGTPFRQC